MSAEVDLRSDTVTRPTAAMRRAMADAVVGDDVLGDDPTVQVLERRIADLLGKEAALYVPSGTMGNQIAVACHAGPGDEVLLEAESHIFLHEQGGIAAPELAFEEDGREDPVRQQGEGAGPGQAKVAAAPVGAGLGEPAGQECIQG